MTSRLPEVPPRWHLTPSSDAEQPVRAIDGYLRSIRRTPGAALVARVPSLADFTGPRPGEVLGLRAQCDLSCRRPTAPRAMGQLIAVTGRVLDEAGRPLRGALVEVWQANAAGKYIHHNDPSPVPVDPHFDGVGQLVTDEQGRFRIDTIKPGGYAVPHEGAGSASGWWRPPHIHLSVFGDGFASRLVTQIYFPGEPLNAFDLLLNSIPDARARERLIARFDHGLSTPEGALGFQHDLVLRGPAETPFEDR